MKPSPALKSSLLCTFSRTRAVVFHKRLIPYNSIIMRNRIRKLLNTVERHARTDVRYLIRGGGAMMVGQVCVSLIGLVTSIAFANWLSKESYGTYQYILTTSEFLTTFSLIGLGRAVVTSVSKGYDGTLDYALKKSFVWGAGALALGIVVGGYYLYRGNVLFALGIGLGTALTLLFSNAKMYISFLNAKRLFALTSSFTVLGLLIPAFVILGALFFTQDILTLIFAYFIANAVVNTGLLLFSRRYMQNDTVDPTVITQSVHLSAQALIGRMAASIDRILLFQFAGPAVLAEFWIAQNIQRNFSHLFKSANSIALPKLTTRSYAKLREGLPRKILLLYVLIIPFIIGYVFVTPYLIALLFPQYLSVVFATQIFGLLFLSLPLQILADTLVGHGMNRALYRITVIGSVTKLCATLSLVPLFGFWGVMYSICIEQCMTGGLTLWYFFTDGPAIRETHSPHNTRHSLSQ